MLAPGDEYYGADYYTAAPSTGAGGAGAGTSSQYYDTVDSYRGSWISDILQGTSLDVLCIVAALMILVLFLGGLITTFVSLVLGGMGLDFSTTDAAWLLIILILFTVFYCSWISMSDDGDDWGGGSFSYASAWAAPSNEKGKPVEPGATGLSNLGNTCYMNSTLQCLSHHQGLREFFLSGEYKSQLNVDNPLGTQGTMANEYAKLMEELWNNEFTVVAPTSFKKVLGATAAQFKGNQQHDSQELLGTVLDRLHEDTNQAVNAAGASGSGTGAEQARCEVEELSRLQKRGQVHSSVVDGATAWLSHVQRNDSHVSRLFTGQLSNTLTCPDPACGHVARRFDTFMCLALPLPAEYCMYKTELVWSNPERGGKYECREFQFRLQKTACVEHLVQQLKAALHTPKSTRIQMAKVYGGKCDKLQGSLSLRSMYNAKLYAYLLPEGTVGTVSLFNRLVKRTTRSVYDRHTGQYVAEPFVYASCTGLPYLLPITATTTVAEVYGAAVAWAKECNGGTFDDVGYLPRVGMCDAYGTACYQPHDQCRACELVPSDAKMLVPTSDPPGGVALRFAGACVDWGTTSSDPDGAQTPPYNSEVDLFPMLLEGKVEETKADAEFDGAMEGGVTLAHCLDKFNKEETLGQGNQWKCDKCKQDVAARKSMALWRVPDVVIIVLKRFYHTGRDYDKIGTLVRFPLRGLDLTRWVEGPTTSGGVVYDLFAVSNHSGTLGGGHYTACAVGPSGVWRSYNDRYVSVVGGEAGNQTVDVLKKALHTRSAYVLMYQRRGTPGAPCLPPLSSPVLRQPAVGSGAGAGAPAGGSASAEGDDAAAAASAASARAAITAAALAGSGQNNVDDVSSLGDSDGSSPHAYESQPRSPTATTPVFSDGEGEDNDGEDADTARSDSPPNLVDSTAGLRARHRSRHEQQ